MVDRAEIPVKYDTRLEEVFAISETLLSESIALQEQFEGAPRALPQHDVESGNIRAQLVSQDPELAKQFFLASSDVDEGFERGSELSGSISMKQVMRIGNGAKVAVDEGFDTSVLSSIADRWSHIGDETKLVAHALKIGSKMSARIELETPWIDENIKVLDTVFTSDNDATSSQIMANYEDQKDSIAYDRGSLVKFAELCNIAYMLSTPEASTSSTMRAQILAGVVTKKLDFATNLVPSQKKRFLSRRPIVDEDITARGVVIKSISKILKINVNNAGLARLEANIVGGHRLENIDEIFTGAIGLNAIALENREVMSEFGIDEANDLDKLRAEELRAKMARHIINVTSNIDGRSIEDTKDPDDMLVIEMSKTPMYDYVSSYDELMSDEEKDRAYNDIRQASDSIDHHYTPTSRQLREIYNGPARARQITEVLQSEHGINNIEGTDGVAKIILSLIDRATTDSPDKELAVLSRNLELLELFEKDCEHMSRRQLGSKLKQSMDLLEEMHDGLDRPQLLKIDSDLPELLDILYGNEEQLPVSANIEEPEPDTLVPPVDIQEELENIRREALEVFPPEKRPKFVDDFIEKVARKGHDKKYLLDVRWERVRQLLKLQDELEQEGVPAELILTEHTSWSPLPFFVLETFSSDGEIVACVETALHKNATYFVKQTDWRETVVVSRQDARKQGAKAKVHSTDPDSHRRKMHATIKTL